MAELPEPPAADHEPRMPRWVKVWGVVAIVVIVLAVVAFLVGGGHGAGRHGSLAGGVTVAGGVTLAVAEGGWR